MKPRLQLLVDRFKDRVDVKPTVTDHLRSVVMLFDSPVARIELKFRLSHDAEVKNLLLEQSLDVLPILMKFEDHSTLSVPLGKVDEAAIAAWCDDCIVSFLKTYAEIHHNQYYLKGHLVTDPIAGVEMPAYAAAATLERDGKTYYFICTETKKEFEARVSTQAKGRA